MSSKHSNEFDAGEQPPLRFIRRLMPNASEEALREAADTFDEYMRVVWEIYQRLRAEGVDINEGSLPMSASP